MRFLTVLLIIASATAWAAAQETQKPVPNDSVRVSIPGCTKGSIFTAGPRTRQEPRPADIPEGMHLRMNAPRKMMQDIKAHEGSMIEITGLMKKGQYGPPGIPLGGGVRVTPGPDPSQSVAGNLNVNQIFIDVEAWHPIQGDCRTK
jgi:hypothetical protein